MRDVRESTRGWAACSVPFFSSPLSWRSIQAFGYEPTCPPFNSEQGYCGDDGNSRHPAS